MNPSDSSVPHKSRSTHSLHRLEMKEQVSFPKTKSSSYLTTTATVQCSTSRSTGTSLLGLALDFGVNLTAIAPFTPVSISAYTLIVIVALVCVFVLHFRSKHTHKRIVAGDSELNSFILSVRTVVDFANEHSVLSV